MSQALDRPTEFKFTEADFQWLRQTASAHSGIVLADVKRNMIYSRLTKRLRVLGLGSFGEYRSLLDRGHNEEFGEFINAITTNLTSFFREPHHFEHLAAEALPQRLAATRRDKRLRVWSAGCSTGEEPYSIAMAMGEYLSAHPAWTYDVLATDLDTRVLERAGEGVYETERVAALDRQRLSRWFLTGCGSLAGRVKVKPKLRERIHFEQLNLVHPWIVDGPLDLLFCRNVVIYFDKPTQRRLFAQFAAVLAPGAFLYIGHAESLHQVSDQFQLVGKTTYRRIG